MRKWIAMAFIAVVLIGAAQATSDNGLINNVESKVEYPYYTNWDYPKSILFKGVAMNKELDTYPVVFLAMSLNNDYIWDEDEEAKFIFILNGEVHEMTLDEVKYTNKNALILEFSGDGHLTLLLRYQRWNHVSISGVYNKKYLLNLGLAQNEPVYRILDNRPMPAPTSPGGDGFAVPESENKPIKADVEDIWG